MYGVLLSCVCSCWPFRCRCLLCVGWCLSCGVVCLLCLVSLVVIWRVEMLRLTLRVVAELCCDVAVRCCALIGLVGCCGNCVLNAVVWCCRVLFMCCLLLFAVDVVVCCVLINGAVRRCVWLVAAVADAAVCCLLVPCDV